MTKLKNTIESRLDQAEERISELEDRSIEIIQRSKKEKRMKQSDEIYMIYGIPSKEPTLHATTFAL